MALISGHPALRTGLAEVIDSEPGLRTVVFESRESAVAGLARARPGVVLIDMALPGAGPLAACHALKQLVRSVPVALYGDQGEDRARIAAWIARADALIDKAASVPELFEELRLVARGRRRLRRPTPAELTAVLGDAEPVERAVLGMCLHGVGVHEISSVLRRDPLEVERIVGRLLGGAPAA